MKKLLLFSVIMIAFTAGTFAQSGTASATATAVIVSPITIAKDADLSFGNIIADTDGGTVVVDPAGARTLNGLTSPSVTGTITAASFTVTGLADATYAIILPVSHIISSGGNNMTVDNFTSTPNATGTLTGGTQTLNVGATLNVTGSQPAGTYTNATGFDVTVNYN
ncbi:MAG: DUF4402 domain-containing protein [Bacteroidales bacterium]|nr:DUF4402 domain-containing protein [Bacteroidales bacterium]MDT8373713.1 DUF4402 domain-containing protein [Bacteroidales bacterium]